MSFRAGTGRTRPNGSGKRASGGNFDALIDTFGDGYVEPAVELGVRPERIDTISGRRATARVGARAYG
ncbi:hypothetical protein [Streptomyces mirabilis]|uniref:hypothetical protein n=1 Tax=Streptomyces mirabilis TaxID=68239 RepID=UPI0036B2D503